MKWAALAVVLAAFFPLADWLRRNPSHTPKVWMLVGVLPFFLATLHFMVAPISWAAWPGYVHGAELTAIDVIAAAFYLVLPRAGGRLPFRLSMVIYFFVVVASTIPAKVPMASLFYAWQLARMFLVYAVVARACADERVVPALLSGMAVGLCIEVVVALWQREHGTLQTGGTLGHQNLLGMMSHFVVFPWVALLLAGQRGWAPVVGPIAGAIVDVLTISRATVGFAAVGCAILFLISAWRQWTSRKAMILVSGTAAAAVLVPVIYLSFQERFEIQPIDASVYDERAAFEKAATMMLSDHPFGVGANNYVVVANTDGYNQRAGVAAVTSSEGANVHNLYFLAAAETGYVGTLTLVLMLLQPIILAFRCGWRHRGDRRGDLLLGLGLSMLIVCIHSFFEWVFISYPAQYMFSIEAGIVAGLAQQLGYFRGTARSGVRVQARRAVGSVAKVAGS